MTRREYVSDQRENRLDQRAYLDTDDEELIKKAERQIAGLSSTRRLFIVIAMPGVLSPEAFSAMKQSVIAYHDAGLEPICF